MTTLLLTLLLAQYQPNDPYHYQDNLRQWERQQEWQHQRQQDRIEQQLEQDERRDDERHYDWRDEEPE